MGADQADSPHAVHERTDVLNSVILVCGRRVFELRSAKFRSGFTMSENNITIQNLQPGLGAWIREMPLIPPDQHTQITTMGMSTSSCPVALCRSAPLDFNLRGWTYFLNTGFVCLFVVWNAWFVRSLELAPS
jgi:hypothetical protein